MSEREQLDTYLKTLSPKVVKNVEILSNEHPLYHISFNGEIKSFVPVIGHRQNDLEDRTVPRICVGPDLLACMLGFADLFLSLCNQKSNGKAESKYKGGWKIYSFDYDFSLKPNNELVPVANYTGEQWLIAYSEASREYKPGIIGEVFCTQLNIVPVSNDYPDLTYKYYLKVDEDFWVDTKNQVRPGCYEITIINPMDIRQRELDLAQYIKPISIGEYLTAKGLNAELLDLASKPSCMKW